GGAAGAMAGDALRAQHAGPAAWEALGAWLARAHATHGAGAASATAGPGREPAGASEAGITDSIRVALKQVRLVRLADPAFAAELERDLEAAGARAAG